ncbi:hypothetical protein [Pseudorhodobacter sp. E13]|uniref:hypothetical protein n=1 Tax=Pseudorhodobacter sp. E13 TaxID=2487931 RepID=UPI001F442E5D|nr:hypothetical protein [Pseudorhodobacter sp. E13]
MGLNSCPPHQQTIDPNTPNSFESEEFRQACLAVFDEKTLSETGSRAAFVDWLGQWILAKERETASQGQSGICLKHPLSAFLIGEIAEVADPIWILVTRKFSNIERTRERRQWHPTFGAYGAQKIYSRAISDLISGGHSFIAVAYEDFRAHKETRDTLIDFAKLRPSESQSRQAESWVR